MRLAALLLLLQTPWSGPEHLHAWQTLELPPALRELLDTGPLDSTPKDFRIVTLSFLTDGCVAQARCDRARQAQLHQEPARVWREYMLAHAMDSALQLPWSEVTLVVGEHIRP